LVEAGPQPSFNPVPLDSHSDRLSCHDANARLLNFIGSHNQHNERVRIRPAYTPHPLEVGGPGQAKPAFHPFTCCKPNSATVVEQTFFVRLPLPTDGKKPRSLTAIYHRIRLV